MTSCWQRMQESFSSPPSSPSSSSAWKKREVQCAALGALGGKADDAESAPFSRRSWRWGWCFCKTKKLKLFSTLKHSFSLKTNPDFDSFFVGKVQYLELTIFIQLKASIFDHQASAVDPGWFIRGLNLIISDATLRKIARQSWGSMNKIQNFD